MSPLPFLDLDGYNNMIGHLITKRRMSHDRADGWIRKHFDVEEVSLDAPWKVRAQVAEDAPREFPKNLRFLSADEKNLRRDFQREARAGWF